MVYLIVILLLTAADQAIKYFVNLRISPEASVPVIENIFYIINRRNSGAAWSFLAEHNWGIYVLAGISFLASVVMITIMLRTRVRWLKISLMIIAGGSIGNLIDRVTQLSVTDYLDFHFGDYVFPTFNLADMLVVCGTILLCIVIMKNPTLLDSPAQSAAGSSAAGAGTSNIGPAKDRAAESGPAMADSAGADTATAEPAAHDPEEETQ